MRGRPRREQECDADLWASDGRGSRATNGLKSRSSRRGESLAVSGFEILDGTGAA